MVLSLFAMLLMCLAADSARIWLLLDRLPTLRAATLGIILAAAAEGFRAWLVAAAARL